MSSVGKRVRELRLKKGLTQKELADKLGMGRSNFGHIENDRVQPTTEDLVQLADLLDTTYDYLFKGTPAPSPEIRAIERAARKMSKEDRKRMLDSMKVLFREAFDEDND